MADANRLSDRLEAALQALRACDVSMDTAAILGVREILGPMYEDSWAAAHTAARAVLDAEGVRD